LEAILDAAGHGTDDRCLGERAAGAVARAVIGCTHDCRSGTGCAAESRVRPFDGKSVMKLHAFALLVAVWSITADGPGDAAKEEHQKLDGTWVVEGVLRDPREKDPNEGKGIRCVIKGDKVVAKLPGDDKPAGGLIIKIDPTKKPKAMDIRPEGENDTILAIYELKGDRLRVCWNPLGKQRPTELASRSGSGQSLVELKREKP
jgi:uncharacterized protein (TIGR03067 family)